MKATKKRNRVEIIKRTKVKIKKRKKKKYNKIKKRPKYSEYINSKKWRTRKAEYYKYHAKECATCESKKQVCLHHMSYKRTGNERDSDLVPLCYLCHNLFHDEYPIKENMIEETHAFIVEKRESNEFSKLTKDF